MAIENEKKVVDQVEEQIAAEDVVDSKDEESKSEEQESKIEVEDEKARNSEGMTQNEPQKLEKNKAESWCISDFDF